MTCFLSKCPYFSYLICALFHDTDVFSLHGSWATLTPSDWREYCKGAEQYNDTALDILNPRLSQDWPNAWGSAASLHKHEWLKHGSCTCLSEVEYFNATLNAFDRYDLNKLVPSGSPPQIEEIKSQFLNAYGYELHVSHQKHGRATDVYFCLDSSWNIMSCPVKMPILIDDGTVKK